MDKSMLRNIIITAVVVIGLGFLYWKFDYSKNSRNIGKLRAEYDKLNTQVAEARKVAARMKEYIDKLKVLEKQLEIADKMLPDEQFFEDAIDSLTILAGRNNVKIKQLTPMPVAYGSETSSIKFQMTVLAKFNTFALYLTEIGNQSRIFQADNVEIKPLKTKDEGDYNITGKFIVTTYFKGTGVAEKPKGGKDEKKK